jgi:hypothetical protein
MFVMFTIFEYSQLWKCFFLGGECLTTLSVSRAAFPKLVGREPICGGSRKVVEMWFF